ncbi:MAG: hypothetical protein QM743_05010 [Chitinophagaceae bacterium]
MVTAFGIPTVGGEIYFENCYQTNPLVNAMSVGVVKVGETVSAIAEGIGNPVFIVALLPVKTVSAVRLSLPKTLRKNSAEDLPAVQVGDPF